MMKRAAVVLAALVLVAGCRRSSKRLTAELLPTLGDSPVSLASCPTAKCLTAYVAPWCPHCREAAPAIISLRDYLSQHGVTTRIVVGMDKPDALYQYAALFGPQTLIDARGDMGIDGVPHFFVSDKNGDILQDVPGMPAEYASLSELAGFFNLP
jgi:thiol-disulfide isomerase/thioredoxin